MNARFFLCLAVFILASSSVCFSDMQFMDLNINFRNSTPMHVEMRNGMFLLPIKINGSAEPYYFYIDTGCEESIINSAVAAKLGIGGMDPLDMYGVGSKTDKTTLTDSLTLDMPGLLITGARMAISPGEFSKNQHVAGLFGSDFIRHTVLKLDYVNQTVTFIDPTRFTDTRQIQIPLGVMGTTPRIEITIVRDGIPYTTPIMVDTGCAGGVVLPNSFMEENPTLKLDNIHTIKAIGIGGFDDEQAGTVPELHLGDQVLKDQPVAVLNKTGQAIFGLLGDQVFSNFVVTIDMADSLLLLRPNEHTNNSPPPASSGTPLIASSTTSPANSVAQDSEPPQPETAQGTGFQVNQTNGSFIVTAVSVHHSGIHVGDQITQIDKTPTAGLDMAHITKLLRNPIRWICVQRDGADMQVRMSSILALAPVQTAAVQGPASQSQAP